MVDPSLVVLRAIHVSATVFRAGGTFLLAGFHEFVVHPGDDERTLDRLADYAGVPQAIGVSGLAVVAGLLLTGKFRLGDLRAGPHTG